MTVSSYRLETVAVNLIEQLEGRRRSYHDRPEAFQEAAARIADESLDSLAREYAEVMGPSGVPDRLRHEIHEVFLPRYLGLARDHNALERRGYDAWRQGDPLSRVVSFVAVLLLVTLVSRVIPLGPMVIPGYALALATPFVPEMRAFYYRRGYQAELERLVDDMARIQRQLDDFVEEPSQPEGRARARAAQSREPERG
jgi:hypothetical protein